MGPNGKIIGKRIKEQIDVEYVFQEIADLPEGVEVPEGRTKNKCHHYH